MRYLAAALLIITTVLNAVLGGGFLLSSRYRSFAESAKVDDAAGNLSSVSADLVSEEELARMRAAELARQEKHRSAAAAERLVGFALLSAVVLGLGAVILAFLRRLPRVAIALTGAALAIVVGAIVARGAVTLLLVAGGLLVAAECVLLLEWRRGRSAA